MSVPRPLFGSPSPLALTLSPGRNTYPPDDRRERWLDVWSSAVVPNLTTYLEARASVATLGGRTTAAAAFAEKADRIHSWLDRPGEQYLLYYLH